MEGSSFFSSPDSTMRRSSSRERSGFGRDITGCRGEEGVAGVALVGATFVGEIAESTVSVQGKMERYKTETGGTFLFLLLIYTHTQIPYN